MAAKRRGTQEPATRRRPATTPEQREQQLASAAYDLAEEQLRTGAASSQVITHFLKAGSMREKLEQARIAHENELLQVKREAMERADRMESLMENAIKAMRSYTGHEPSDPDDEED